MTRGAVAVEDLSENEFKGRTGMTMDPERRNCPKAADREGAEHTDFGRRGKA
jgi:hypothetical protein